MLLTLKAHGAAGGARRHPAAARPEATAVVTLQNGVPWWYFHGLDGPFRDARLSSVDPGGSLWDGIGPERAIGCVVYPAAEIEAPGVVRHVDGVRFSLGEPTGEKSAACPPPRRGADRRRPAGPGARRHPQRDLGQALGQPLLQPDLGAHRRHARGDRRRRRHARRRPRHDAGGPGDRRGAGRPLPDRRRPPHPRAPAPSARTRRRCSRTWSAAGRWRSTRWSASVQELGRLVGKPTPTVDTVLALVRRLAAERGLG